MVKGTIIRIVSQQYIVETHTHELLACVPMGKLRKGIKPVVGDYVYVEMFSDQNGIQKIMPRKNELIRPPIANVDQAIVVMSCKEPDFSSQLLDYLLFGVMYANIHPIICFTKTDLVNAIQLETIIQDYKQSGYEVYTSSISGVDLHFSHALKDKISVLAGQSGAGKSSLLNHLDANMNLQTQQISKALGRGKHTTRHSELYRIAQGWLADTPGFSSLDFSHMDIQKFAHCIDDFKPYLGMCKFRDCVHDKEPDCKVKQQVEAGNVSSIRYQHYIEILHEIRKGGK